jgi:energy-coupling factor transporter ATP-binding protein EcfA2
MELQLIYVYIHKYKGIVQQGFNLHSGYQVSFEDKDGRKVGTEPYLKIELIESSLPHLFHPQIRDVRGIIGENGAGKSTLIEYLTYAAHDQTYLQDIEGNCRDILVYQCFGQRGRQLKVVLGSSWDRQLIEDLAEVPLDTDYMEMQQFQYDELEDFRSTAFVYYSNVFDNKSRPLYGELHSVSTNYLLRKDKEKLTNARVEVDPLDAHQTMEARRQVEFVLQFYKETNLPLDIPKEIYVRYNSFAQQSLKKKLEKANRDAPHETGTKMLRIWLWYTEGSRLPKMMSHQTMLKLCYIHYFIDNYLLVESDTMNSTFPGWNDYRYGFFKYLMSQGYLLRGAYDLDVLEGYARDQEVLVSNNPGNVRLQFGAASGPIGLGDSSLLDILTAFRHFYDFLFGGQVDIKTAGPAGFALRLNDHSMELYKRYYGSMFVTTYLDFSFPELSSGELGFLTLFSRFYSLVMQTRTLTWNTDNKRNLIIFIDEGDLYFHPSWQAKLLHYVNEMLPRIFPFFTMQLVMSSHSPFIASDLTPDHLLFLKRTGKSAHHTDLAQPAGEVVEGPERTFAANIHELLSDSFFMKGAHIGELAKNTLYKLLDQLEGNSKVRHFKEDELEPLIWQMGEPWMRSRLMEKLESYRPLNR